MNKLSEIHALKKQLSDLGYRGFQIDNMIKDEIGTVKLADLSDPQAEQVIDLLQDYIQFAHKCQKGKNK